MPPKYDFNKIKFSTDDATFKRAVGLYESGSVTDVTDTGDYYTAVVNGTKSYRTSVSARNYQQGHCTCYLGQQGSVCKHMVAVAVYAVRGGCALSDKDTQFGHAVVCSGRQDLLNNTEIATVKKAITEAMKYIKPYSGPSRTWFRNQESLQEGCNRLSAVVSGLPVNAPAAEIVVKMLVRLDKKLCVGGVDDSNGIVSGFMNDVVAVLLTYIEIDRRCITTLRVLSGMKTCFGWEAPLMKFFDGPAQK
jgi:hypothetical protein